jgi:heme exporter protein A
MSAGQPCVIEARDLSKRFGVRRLFSGLNFSLETGHSLAIAGPNGSGKSTLLQILAGLRRPTTGAVAYVSGGVPVQPHERASFMGFLSPLVLPYRDLTGWENLRFAADDGQFLEEAHRLLGLFGLEEHRHSAVKTYSTGMLQRLKYCLALAARPPFVLLDEPASNLDARGKDALYGHLKSIAPDRIIIIATNDRAEAALCGREISLGS